MKPVCLLILGLASLLRAEDTAPLPGNPTEHGVPGTNTGPAAAGNGATPVFRIAPADSYASPAQQEVTAKLPKYDPAAPKESKPTGTIGTPSPDAIELPKMTIRKPKERPRLAPAAVITNKALEEKAGVFDSNVLNKFTLPGWLGGQTAAERAREEQRLAEKEALNQDVKVFAKALEATDPAKAKALRDAAAKP